MMDSAPWETQCDLKSIKQFLFAFLIQPTYTVACQLAHFVIQFGLNEYLNIYLYFFAACTWLLLDLISEGYGAWLATAKMVPQCIVAHEIAWMHCKLCNSLTKLLRSCNFSPIIIQFCCNCSCDDFLLYQCLCVLYLYAYANTEIQSSLIWFNSIKVNTATLTLTLNTWLTLYLIEITFKSQMTDVQIIFQQLSSSGRWLNSLTVTFTLSY